MSRFLQIQIPIHDLADITQHLDQLGLEFELAEEEEVLMLPGNFECPEQPVDIRILTSLDTVSGFGFSLIDQQYCLVCNELDRKLLMDRIMVPLSQNIALKIAQSSNLDVECTVQPNGTHTITLREPSD